MVHIDKKELTAEQEAVAKIQGVNYFNNGSDQVPKPENLDRFFKIMDNKDNYLYVAPK